MKRTLYFSAVALCVVSLTACHSNQDVKGNGKMTTQERNLPNFSKIDVKGKFHVLVTRRWPQKTTVTTDENLQQYVMTVVKNGVLDVMPKQGYNIQPTQTITINLAARKVDAIATKGECVIDASGLNTDKFKFASQGNCRATLAGRVDHADIDVQGNARIDAKDLIAQELGLDIKGATEASVYASKTLDVKIEGDGNVIYYGKPPVVNQAIFGGGKLQAAKKPS